MCQMLSYVWFYLSWMGYAEEEEDDEDEDEDQMKSVVKCKQMKSSRIFVVINSM